MTALSMSYSRIKTFRDCARKFYHMNVAPKGSPERVVDIQGKKGREGDRAHKALETRVKYQRPLPSEFLNFEPFAAPIAKLAVGADVVAVENGWAFRRDLSECEWFDRDAWFRVRADVAIVRGSYGLLADWKTGKIFYDTLQLNINSVFMILKFPQLEVVESRLVWLNHDDVTEHEVRAAEIEYVMDEILDAVAPIEQHAKINHWPARPGAPCGWCPVNKAGLCEKADRPYASKWA